MGFEVEGQFDSEYQAIRSRELQLDSISKLAEVSNAVDDLNIDQIEEDTKVIKHVVMNNLEDQINLDDLDKSINKILQGIADIKRNQTNLTKRIKTIEEKVGESDD